MGLLKLNEFVDGPRVFERERFSDDRGYFEMIMRMDEIKATFPKFPDLLQINLIKAKVGALRGFHVAPIGSNHWKVLTVVVGNVRDAFLDIREKSENYGCISFIDMSAVSGATVVIPPGFAHAVQSLSAESITIYGTNIPYSKNNEFEIHPFSNSWTDIWQKPAIISRRDEEAPVWKN